MKIFRCFLLLLAVVFLMPGSVHAATDCPPGTPTDRVCIESPIEPVTASAIVGTIIKGVLGFVGAITFVMFVWGGALWIFSAGNAEKVEQGTKTMLWAAVGLVVVFSSYIVLSSVISFLTTGN
jgi:Type IV secretion system pilin